MKRLASLVALGLLCLGATQINVDRDENYFCTVLISDAAVSGGAGTQEGVSCNGFSTGVNLLADSGLLDNFNVPTDRRLQIEAWGFVVISALGATENCDIRLMTDTSPTGAGSILDTMSVGPGQTETGCQAGSLTIDAANEACTLVVNTSVPPGGLWRFSWDDPDDGGALVCSAFQGGTIWLRGRYIPQ